MKTIINHNGCILKTTKLNDHQYTYRKTSTINTTKRINPFYDNGTEDFSSLLGELYKEINQLDYIKEFGREVAWCGEPDINYIYTGKNHKCSGWNRYIWLLTTVIREFFQYPNVDDIFNHCLINKYDATMYLNSHKDNEPELTGAIASLTLGDSAWFRYGLTNNIPKQTNLQLNNGDIMIGNRKFFETYYHSVSQPINGKTRFNLTWRTICNN